MRVYCGERFVFLTVKFFDVYRLDDSHTNAAAALVARVAPPSVLANAAAAAVLALAPLPPVLAKAAAAALLALGALSPVLAKAATATVLAPAPLPAMRTGHHAILRAETYVLGAICAPAQSAN